MPQIKFVLVVPLDRTILGRTSSLPMGTAANVTLADPSRGTNTTFPAALPIYSQRVTWISFWMPGSATQCASSTWISVVPSGSPAVVTLVSDQNG